ncbi:hypothetical protein BASA83_010036 [Batrachochytrium salamandrivorans]|nr:hypothetical protein BASA81_011398 [Batrachochytrium salamandrivorans]KAH9267302.1 hypothetical protein BASA83_010036 [Batrachochytrium salamandrivorans]
MRLIFFAMVSLLAITVSAQPPHNPDTQNTNPSPDDAIQNMNQSPDISDQDMQEFMDLFDQNAQQPQGAATQMSDQPQGSGTQSVQQSPDATTQNAQQSQESDDQMLNQPQSTITQSEQQFHGISLHNMHQSQDAATQNTHSFMDDITRSLQESDKDRIWVEMDRLTKAYRMRNKIFFQIGNYIRAENQRALEINDIIKAIDFKLEKTGIRKPERLKLEKKSYDLKMVTYELAARHKEQSRSYINSMKRRNEMYAELQLLKENQELIAEHNSKNVFKVGLSHGSCYNTGILKKQYGKILKDIGESLAEQKRIKGAMLLPGSDAFEDQSKKLDNTIRILQHYNVVARRILWQQMNGQPIGAWISKFLDSYMQNIKI